MQCSGKGTVELQGGGQHVYPSKHVDHSRDPAGFPVCSKAACLFYEGGLRHQHCYTDGATVINSRQWGTFWGYFGLWPHKSGKAPRGNWDCSPSRSKWEDCLGLAVIEKQQHNRCEKEKSEPCRMVHLSSFSSAVRSSGWQQVGEEETQNPHFMFLSTSPISFSTLESLKMLELQKKLGENWLFLLHDTRTPLTTPSNIKKNVYNQHSSICSLYRKAWIAERLMPRIGTWNVCSLLNMYRGMKSNPIKGSMVQLAGVLCNEAAAGERQLLWSMASCITGRQGYAKVISKLIPVLTLPPFKVFPPPSIYVATAKCLCQHFILWEDLFLSRGFILPGLCFSRLGP